MSFQTYFQNIPLGNDITAGSRFSVGDCQSVVPVTATANLPISICLQPIRNIGVGGGRERCGGNSRLGR